MGAFAYKALDARGQFVSGELQAASVNAAVQQLMELGYVPLATIPREIETRGWTVLPRPAVTQREVTVLLQDLALLLRSGLPLDEGLLLLTENAGGAMIRLITQLRSAIGSGANFAEALSAHPATASPELIAVVRAAEASGALETALEAIAEERAKRERLNAQIRSALRYPAFLLLVSLAVLLFFLLFVVPQFADVIGDFGTRPNTLITTVIALSTTLRDNGDIAVAAIAALLGLALLAGRRPRIRRRVLGTLAGLPLVRGIVVLRRTAQLCRSLGMMLSSGVTLTDALRLMTETGIGGDRLAVVTDRVRRGERLVDAAAATGLVPPLAVRMLRVGEESGALASIALRCASYYEAKLTEQVERLTGIVGPAAIVFISVVIGTLLVSIMSTLLSINQMVM
jgi:general secretion pathway protein F